MSDMVLGFVGGAFAGIGLSAVGLAFLIRKVNK